jgi:hypothetical protein
MKNGGRPVILPKERDPRFITIRRGGTLADSHHRLLAQWAAKNYDSVYLPFCKDQDWHNGQGALSPADRAGGPWP